MLDKALVGGFVVTDTEERILDIGIEGGKIVALSEPGKLPEAKEVIDVSGMTLVPGGIDPHIHCDLAIDHEGHEPAVSFGPDVIGKAALMGGTTMLIDFVWKEANETIKQAREKLQAHWDKASPVDYSFHIVLRGDLDQQVINEIPSAIEAGFPSFKVFTTNVFPSAPIGGVPLKINFGSLHEVMKQTSQHGGILAVHGEDDDIVQHQYRRFLGEGKAHYTNMHLVHNTVSEDLAFRRVIRLARETGGAPIYFMHTSAATGVNAVAEARSHGQAVYAETLHQYALHTFHDYAEPDGMKYHTYPSLKDHSDTERLWTGVADGSISTFATDGQSTTYKVKTQGKQIDDVVGGNSGVEPRMVVLFTEIVDKRGLGLRTFVDVTSTNAAKIMGMYPQKGAIAVGSDADIAVFETGLDKKVTVSELHESDYTPWEGWPVTVWPRMTLLRGKIVGKDGEFVGDPAGGAWVPRKLHPRIADGIRYV